ncbi:MAG: cell division protein FtsL [Firmicutes bacterium]|nr:cell division protein FtsL [Bacillota bacterium]
MVPAVKTPHPQPWHHPDPGSLGASPRPKPGKRPVSPFIVLPVIAILTLGVGMGLVAQRVAIMSLGFELGELERELARLQDEHRRLELETVRARSPERIESLARSRLQMVDPGPATVVVLGDTETATADTAQAAPPAPAGPISRLAAFGQWLLDRLAVPAEAGDREP